MGQNELEKKRDSKLEGIVPQVTNIYECGYREGNYKFVYASNKPAKTYDDVLEGIAKHFGTFRHNQSEKDFRHKPDGLTVYMLDEKTNKWTEVKGAERDAIIAKRIVETGKEYAFQLNFPKDSTEILKPKKVS